MDWLTGIKNMLSGPTPLKQPNLESQQVQVEEEATAEQYMKKAQDDNGFIKTIMSLFGG